MTTMLPITADGYVGGERKTLNLRNIRLLRIILKEVIIDRYLSGQSAGFTIPGNLSACIDCVYTFGNEMGDKAKTH